ncbi:MAG: ABC transporter ATP-binding protein [Muricoprocola sp.]
MDEVIIQTSGLTKCYGEKTAVNHLNLSIKKGEIFGLLGPNGAGKTTTILMLLGLTEPSAGTATIHGMDCTRNALGIKKIVGYLPDNPGFYQDMTGRQNLAFTGRLNGLSEEEIKQRSEGLLKRVGLEEAADRKAGTYSKGMRQRLGIADVLMKDPEIIIMDEPTLGLDPEGMRELLELMKEMSKEDGRTLLISSHQLYQVQQICDRVGIFVNGNLVACGDIEELGNQVQDSTVYSLELQADPCDDKVLAEISRQPGVSNIRKEGNMFIVESKFDIRQELTGFMGRNGYTIQHMHQRGGDLDTIYRMYFERAEAEAEEAARKAAQKGKLHKKLFRGGGEK